MIIRKRDNVAAYEFIRRHIQRHNLQIEIFYNLNGKTILEAANSVGLDITSFLIYIGHLKRLGLIKEVRIV